MTNTNTPEPAKISKKEWIEMDREKVNAILEKTPLIERLKVLQNTPTSMNPFEWWLSKSKAELMQWYMNAQTTYAQCGGHDKASRNQRAVKNIAELMKIYEIPIPQNEICYVLGVFNGKGSS